jgi:hypothetical protein
MFIVGMDCIASELVNDDVLDFDPDFDDTDSDRLR